MLSIFLCEIIAISRIYQARKANPIGHFSRAPDVQVSVHSRDCDRVEDSGLSTQLIISRPTA
jgi:hypothetical protein